MLYGNTTLERRAFASTMASAQKACQTHGRQPRFSVDLFIKPESLIRWSGDEMAEARKVVYIDQAVYYKSHVGYILYITS